MSVLRYGDLQCGADVCVAVWVSNGDLQGGADVCVAVKGSTMWC